MTDLAPKHSRLLLTVVAVFLPPLSVYLKTRDWLHTIVSIVLTLLLWLPGFLHALFFIFRPAKS